MPLTRPDVISDRVSLSDKLTRKVRTLVPEDGAIDALLSAVINEPSPSENRICSLGAEHDFFTGSDKLHPLSAILIVIA